MTIPRLQRTRTTTSVPPRPKLPPVERWAVLGKESVCLTIWVLLAGHEGEDRLGVVIGLLLAGGTRVLPIVRQLIDAPQVTDGITARETGKSVLASLLVAEGGSLVTERTHRRPQSPEVRLWN